MAVGVGSAAAVIAGTPRSLRPAAVLSLLWHLVLLGAVTLVGYGYLHVDDPVRYDRVAAWMAEQWRHGTLPDLYRSWGISSFGYYYWSAALYRVFGHHPWIPQAANLVFAVVAGILTFRLVGRLSGSDHAARAAAVGVLFYPTLAVWSVMMLKDILVAVLLLASLDLGFTACERPAWRRWILLALAGFAASVFRFYFGILALGIGAVMPLALRVRPRRQALAAAALLTLALAGSFGVGEGHWYLQAIENREHLASTVAQLSRGESSLEPELREANLKFAARPGDAAGLHPEGSLAWKVARFFLVPLPSQRGSLLVEIGKLDWLFWWPLLMLSLLGLWRALFVSWPRTTFIALPIAVLVVFYALLIGNAGTLIRYRAALFPLFAVLGGVGLDELAGVSATGLRALWARFA